jgi:hypothetical protein
MPANMARVRDSLAGSGSHIECLRTRYLIHEVAINVEQDGAVRLASDDVGVEYLFIKRAAHVQLLAARSVHVRGIKILRQADVFCFRKKPRKNHADDIHGAEHQCGMRYAAKGSDH